MKKLNEVYRTPNMEVIEMLVEQSVLTNSFGDFGDAGQSSKYVDPDFDL